MVATQAISQAQFLDMYTRKVVENCVVLTVSGQQRIYGRTTEQQSNNLDKYIVVYAVIA